MSKQIFRFEIKDDTDDILVGRFTYTDRPNNNGFIFTKEAMKIAIDNFWAENNTAFGHLGSDRERYTDIDLSKVSHTLQQMYEEEEGDGWGVEVKILDTPSGIALKKMIDAGVDLQFNGVYEGVINEETKEVEKLKFITIDVLPVKDD